MKAQRFPKFEVSASYESYLDGGNSVPISDESETETVSETSEEISVTSSDEPTFEERVDKLLTLVTSQNPLREVLYKILGYCREQRDFSEVEDFIASQDEFIYSHIIQTPYTLIQMLNRGGGVIITPYDEEGAPLVLDVATKSEQPVLDAGTESEAVAALNVEDLTCGYYVNTTKEGEAIVKMLSPQTRIYAQLNQKPHRRDTYIALMQFCRQPRSLPDIKEFFEQSPDLTMDVVAHHHKLSPDYYVDKLDKAGALVWRGSWNLTEEGKAFLEEDGREEEKHFM